MITERSVSARHLQGCRAIYILVTLYCYSYLMVMTMSMVNATHSTYCDFASCCYCLIIADHPSVEPFLHPLTRHFVNLT